MVARNKKADLDSEDNIPEDLPMAPPDTQYLSERYIVEIPISDERLKNPWQLRLYAEKELEGRLGDEVQLTSLKVKKPRALARSKARLLKREPTVRLYVTVKF